MLTYGILTNAIQNEWNIIGSFMSPLQPQNTPWLYHRQEDHFYTGFKDGMSVKRTFRYISHPLTATPLVFLVFADTIFKKIPSRPHDYEAVGAFIIERRPEGALATSLIPLIFIGWIGVFGTLIPKDSGEKLRSVLNRFYHQII